MVDKLHISWEEFHNHTKLLAQKIKESGEYNKIIAISRGGLLPAGIISYELDIRNTHAINISSYDGDQHRDVNDIELEEIRNDVDDKTLIVDDLSDTGTTLRLLRKMFPQGKFVTVYAKPQGVQDVDIYAHAIPDKWVVFPWDI